LFILHDFFKNFTFFCAHYDVPPAFPHAFSSFLLTRSIIIRNFILLLTQQKGAAAEFNRQSVSETPTATPFLDFTLF